MAINFPATPAGTATDGSYTHTSSGITWAWDGTSWLAQGVTGSYVLPVASTTALGGVKIDGTSITIDANGVISSSGGGSGGTATDVASLTDVPTSLQWVKSCGTELLG